MYGATALKRTRCDQFPQMNRLRTRTDLAWAISVGGIGIVLFAAMLLFTWYFAATLFLIFTGMLLGVAPQRADQRCSAARAASACVTAPIVCLALAVPACGCGLSRRLHHCEQATLLSKTIKSQTRQRQGLP